MGQKLTELYFFKMKHSTTCYRNMRLSKFGFAKILQHKPGPSSDKYEKNTWLYIERVAYFH